MILRFLASAILLLAIIVQGGVWIPMIGVAGSLGVTGVVCLLAFIAINLDFYFWRIRRAHDIGHPWPFALLQEVVFLSMIGAILAVLEFANLPPFAMVVACLFPFLLGGWAIARSFTWIAGHPGDEGPNAYGDPPEPLAAPDRA